MSRILKLTLAGAAGALAGLAAWMLPGSRTPPAERERRRRLLVNARGRTGNATILEVREGMLWYQYPVGGVDYTASQDISALRELLPEDPSTLIAAPATLKYLAHNPANSIVVCEEWSGLHFRPVGLGSAPRPEEDATAG